MARRWFSRKGLTLESEQVDIIVHDTTQLRLNGLRILTTNDTSTGPQGPEGPAGIPTSLAVVGTTPNANAMTLNGSTLNLEAASASFPGVVTTGAQTFAGVKTFQNGVSGGSIVNALGTIGSSANANGGSISGNTLTLQPASTSFGGVMTTSAQSFSGRKDFTGGLGCNSGQASITTITGGQNNWTLSLDTGTINSITSDGSSITTSTLPSLNFFLTCGSNVNVNSGNFLITNFSITSVTGSPTTIMLTTPGTVGPTNRKAAWPIYVTNGGTPNQAAMLTFNAFTDGKYHIQLVSGAVFTTPFGLDYNAYIPWMNYF